MTFWQFASDNPGGVILLAIVIFFGLHAILSIPFRAYNRHLRSMNIRAAGWPPEHLDADGDFKQEDAGEEE